MNRRNLITALLAAPLGLFRRKPRAKPLDACESYCRSIDGKASDTVTLTVETVNGIVEWINDATDRINALTNEVRILRGEEPLEFRSAFEKAAEHGNVKLVSR